MNVQNEAMLIWIIVLPIQLFKQCELDYIKSETKLHAIILKCHDMRECRQEDGSSP